MKNIRAFTLIELIVTITVLAMAVIPASMIAMEAVRAIASGDSQTMAAVLAQRELGIVNTLAFGDSTLAVGYNNLSSGYLGYKYDLRRAVSAVAGTSDLKKVVITVYPAGLTAQAIELDTYVINNALFPFGLGIGGVVVSPEGGSMSASGSSWSGGNRTLNVTTMSNASPNGNITVMRVSIWRAAGASFNLTSATMDATTVWTGALAVPTSQPASPNVVLAASCIIGPSGSVTSNTFVFSASPGKGQTIYIKYRMSDGTDSATFTFAR